MKFTTDIPVYNVILVLGALITAWGRFRLWMRDQDANHVRTREMIAEVKVQLTEGVARLDTRMTEHERHDDTRFERHELRNEERLMSERENSEWRGRLTEKVATQTEKIATLEQRLAVMGRGG